MASGPKTKPPRRWRRVLIGLGIGGCLLLVIGWFVVTSESFLKSVVLPRVGRIIHADLTAESVTLRPFSSVLLRGIRLTPESGGQLISATEIEIQYQLSDLLDGIIALDVVRIVEPSVTIRSDDQGRNNLAGWLAEFDTKSTATVDSKKQSGPLQFAVGTVEISGGRFEYLEQNGGAGNLRLLADDIGVLIDQFRNGGTSRAKIGMNVLVEHVVEGSATNDFLSAKLETTATIAFAENLFPRGLELGLTGRMDKAMGRFRESTGLETSVSITSSASKVRSASVTFSRGGNEVGSILIDGELALETGTGDFDLVIRRLPPIVLELASLKLGWDFDLSTFDSTNHVVMAGGGGPVRSAGNASVRKFAISGGRGGVPALDVDLAYDLRLEPGRSLGVLDVFQLSINTPGSGRASASITEPFQFTWRDSFGSETGSRLDLKLDEIKVGDWTLLTGGLPVDGTLNLGVAVRSKNAGQDLELKGTARLRDGKLMVGTNRFDGMRADLEFDGNVAELQNLSVRSLALKVAKAGQPPLTIDGSGTLKFEDLETDLRTVVTLPMSLAAPWMPDLPDTFSDTSVSFAGDVKRGPAGWTFDGRLKSSAFDLPAGPKTFNAARIDVPFVAGLATNNFRWKIDGATLQDSSGELLSIVSDGNVKIADGSGQFSIGIPRVRTQVINGFAINYLGGRRLGSGWISIDLQSDVLSDGGRRWSAAVASTNIVFVGANGVPATDALGGRSVVEAVFHPGKREFELVKLEGDLYSDGTSCGKLRGSGRVRLDGQQARLKIAITDVNENALRPVSHLLIGNRVLEKVDIDVDLDLNYHEDKPSGLSAIIGINDLLVKDPAGLFPFESRSLSLGFDSRIDEGRIDVTKGELQLTATDNASNRVELVGWLGFDDPGAIEGDLSLASDGFDITPIYDLFSRSTGVEAPEVTADNQRKKLSELRSAREAMTLPVKRLEISVDFREVYFRELVVTNWIAKCVIGSNTVDVAPFSLSLNGAPVNIATSMSSNPDSFEYSIAAEFERVRLFPIVTTFYPDWTGQARADIYGAIDLTGRIGRDASVWSSARGNLHLGVTNASAQLLSPRWESLLRPAGLLLQTPELFSSPVNWLYSHTELGDQELEIHQYTIKADAYIAEASGVIPLRKKEFVASEIPNIPVHLYLSRNLLTRLNLVETEEEKKSSYVALPDFLFVQGTFEEPRIEIDKLKTSGMVLGKAGDFVGGAVGDVFKGAGELTGDIGGILSGRKLAGTNTNLGPISQGIGLLFNSIGGIFGGTGNAIEKGAGVVTGTEVVDDENMAERFHSFDWPRQFTNAPNSITTLK